jgi:hypothetical protein
MLEAEAKALAREVDNYLVLSTTDLREKLSKRGAAWNQADEALHTIVAALPERNRLALQCLLIRDLHHILELYLEHARSTQPEAISLPAAPQDILRTPFSEWLFEG